MTREQAKKQLISLGIEEPTEEQISALLNSIGTEIQAEKNKHATDEAELTRLKEIETNYNTLTAQNQTAEQKLQAALDAAELAKKDFAKKTNRLEVEKILVTAGLTEEDYKDFIDSMVSDNAEVSMKLATGFTTTLKAQKESVEKAVKADLLNKTPTPDGNAGDGKETKTEDVLLAESLVSTRTDASKSSQSALNFYLPTGGNK